jgi:tetratricopeptide (TPR) repeat protein
LALKYPTEAFDQFNRVEKLAESSVEQGEYLYYYAQALEQVGSIVPALNAWKELLDIPPAELKSEWQQMARQRVAALSSPTPTATFTRTPTPTRTVTLTRTPTRRSTP